MAFQNFVFPLECRSKQKCKHLGRSLEERGKRTPANGEGMGREELVGGYMFEGYRIADSWKP